MKRIYNLKTRVILAVACLMMGISASAQVDVVATGGVPAASYTTLAGAFAAINAGTHTGNIGIGISASTTETGACVLNASGAGSALYTAIGIAPTVDGVSISGPTTTGRGLIELNGADNVTIDGDNSNTGGINRNLTITNTAANTITFTSVIRIASSTLITTNDNITIKNCNLTGSGTGRNTSAFTTEVTTWGVIASGGASTVATTTAPSALASATTAVPTGQSLLSLVVDNNNIQTASRGISVNGSGPAVAVGLTVTNNIVGNAVVGDINQVTAVGITVQGSSNAVVRGNIVMVEGFIASSTPNRGINLGMISATGLTGALIEKNTVARVINNNTATYPATGIDVTGGTNHIIQNNFVGNCLNNQVGGAGGFGFTFGAYGIRLSSGTGHKVYNNTVSFTGVVPGAVSTNVVTCLAITGVGLTGLDVRNNIFSNKATGGNATLYNDVFVCIMIPSGATSAMNLTLNNNAYYQGALAYSGIAQVGTTGSAANLYLSSNFNAGATAPANNLRSYTSTLSASGTNDNASYASSNAAPLISATNLHIDLASPELANVEQKGDAAVAVTTDIDGDVRPNASTTNPDMGADEVIAAGCVSANGGTISPSTINKCAGSTATLVSTGASTGTGISYQWMISTTPGGPYSNVTGGTGATTTSYTTGALAVGTYYYVLQTTCTSGPITGLSNEVTVTVTALPTVSVTPTTGSICAPGGSAVALTASGATTFAWGPAAGLSATTGASVNALPTSTTTYTVTGTDGSGCTATATSVITVTQTPVISSVTATPSSVCSGGNSQLLAAATVPTPVNAYAYSTGIGAALDPMTGATNALGTGNDDTPTAAPAAIGFTFNFNGTNYTQFSVSPDGWILLGGATAAAQFTNAVTSATNIPKIYPYWDDLATGTTGNVKTLVSGTAPNRILMVQWFVTVPRNTAGPANSTFQAWLYEATGVVEFRYGTMGVPTSGTISSGMTGAAANFQSITFATNTSSTAAANDANTTAPAIGRIYTFTPPSPTYLWTPATFLSSTTINNPMANAVTTTTTYTVEASNGACSSTSTVTITAGSALTSSSTITPSASACVGTTVTFNSIPVGGGSPYTFAWVGPNSFASTLQNPTLVTSAAAAGTYTVTVTDNCGSTSSSTVTLTINALPTVSVTPTTGSFCNPGGTAVALAASGTSTSYAWLPAAGLSSTTGANVNASPTGTTTYTVTGTDGNGCTSTATALITSNNAIAITSATATPSTVCAGGNSALTAVASPVIAAYCTASATSLSFEKISNLTFGTINNTSSATAGYENFTAVSTNVAATVSTPISIGVSQAYATDDRIHIWVDMNQDGVFANPAENVLNAAISTFCPTCAGTATVVTGNITIPVTALNGTTRMRIRLQDQSSGPNSTPCGTSTYGQVEDYTVNITGGTASSISYLWSPGTYLSSTTVSNPTASAIMTSETYTVVATSTAGCSASATVAITANPTPVASATSTTILCNGGTSTVTVSATGGTPAYTGTGSFTASAGAYSYTVTDVNGCSSTATGTITEPTPIAVTSSQTTVLCNGGTSTVTISATGGTGTLTGTGSFTQSAGTTVYTVTDANGCTGTTSVVVTEPTVIAVTATPGTISCFGGSASVAISATGGTGTLTGTGSFSQSAGTTVYTVTDANGCTGTASVTLTQPTLLVATSSETSPIMCNGGTGTVTVSASGGTPSYTGTGAMPQVAGSTTYTVTDANGCTATTSTTITEPTAVAVSYSETGVLCNGGSSSVTIMATGGTTPYAVPFTSGSNTFSQTAGTVVYTVTDANGCTGTASVTVTEPAVLAATNSVSGSILCNGGTTAVVVSATGGTSPYTGDGSMMQGAGTTVYTVTDANGCTATTSATLTEPTAVMVMTSFSPIMCNGDSTLVTVTGMDGTPGYTGEGTFFQLAGTTTYTVTDTNGCVGAVNLSITQPAAIASAQSFNFCGSGSVTVGTNTYTTAGTYTDVLSAANSCDSTVTTTITVTTIDVTTTTSLSVITSNSSVGTYQWINCGTSLPISGATSQSYSATADGSYAVEVTDNGCVDTSACVMIIGAGIANNSTNEWSVYPNPTMGMFNISINNANIAELVISIVDIQGKEVFTSADKNVSGSFNKQINLEEVAKGLYYIKVNTGAEVRIQKLIVQ